MRYLLAMAALMGLTALKAQRPVPHATGPALTTDINDDGRADVLVFDRTGWTQAYFGVDRHPLLEWRSRSWFPLDRAYSRPVANGHRLYVPCKTATRHAIDVDVQTIDPGTGHLMHKAIHVQRTVSPAGVIDSAEILALDGNVLLAWTESDGNRTRAFLAPVGSSPGAPREIPAIPGAPARLYVVGLHRAASPLQGSGEALIVFSALAENTLGGYGFTMVHDGPRLGQSLWFPGFPTLMFDEPDLERQESAYGRFSPGSVLGVPYVKTIQGPSVLHHIDSIEPFVGQPGQVHRTNAGGFHVTDAIADYDGDGFDDLVWIDSVHSAGNSEVIIADPGHQRAFVQRHDTDPLDSGAHRLRFGTAGDFDGDGDPDLLMLAESRVVIDGSAFFLYRNHGRGGARPLQRAW